MSSSPKEPRSLLQIPLEEIVLATNNFGDENVIFEGEFVNVYKAKLLGSAQLGNIVVQRRLNSVYEPWEDEVWMQGFKISGFQQDDDMNSISIVGFCDENIIVYKHVELDLSDPTFNWMQRLRTCTDLASRFVYGANRTYVTSRILPFMGLNLELVHMISLGDLMFQVLCGKKAEEQYPTRMAIEHYEKGELEKIMDPNLRLQMHHQSFTIFSKTAYNCIKQPYINNIYHIQKGLQEALELQRKHEEYLWALGMKKFKTSAASSLKKLDGLEIPCEEIALATNNFADENLIHKGEFVTVYKGKLLEFFRQQEVIVVRRLDLQSEDELWMQVLEISRIEYDILRFVGFCGKSIIVYEHVELKKDLSDPTFDWMQRLCICTDLASRFICGAIWSHRFLVDIDEPKASATISSRIQVYEEHRELVHMISLGDLMFEVLCEKKAEEHAITPMAIEHYEKGELEKIIHPNLRLQMNEQSFTIFSKTAYNCIKQQYINIDDIKKGLQEALELQIEHDEYLGALIVPSAVGMKNSTTGIASSSINLDDLQISFEEIASATNNFSEENLIHKGEFVNVYKGRLLGSRRLGNIVVRMLDRKWEDELWMQVLEISHLNYLKKTFPVVGFCTDKNIIVYEHVELKKDLSDLTFNWMQRLRTCIDLATRFRYGAFMIYSCLVDIGEVKVSATRSSSIRLYKEYFELVYSLSLGDLLFQVLCEKKAKEHPTRMAIELYKWGGKLEKIIDPNLRVQMHQQSFTIFSKTAYDCIEQRHNNFDDIVKGLEEGLKLQREHEKYLGALGTKNFKTSASSLKKFDDLEIPFEEIASATNNFGDQNLIHKGKFVNVYKGKLLQSGQLGNIVVQRRLDRVYQQWEDELWMLVLEISHFNVLKKILPVVGFCDHKNIIVYEHVELKNDLRDPTFNWMQRLQTCTDLAPGFIFGCIWSYKYLADIDEAKVSATISSSIRLYKEYFELVYSLSLGDLMFEVLCEKKAEEHPTPMAIDHYEKGKLEKNIDPNLRVQMHDESFTMFSKTAYECIKRRYINIADIKEGLEQALKLQADHKENSQVNPLEEPRWRRRIPLEEIVLATNNFGDQNLIHKGKFVNFYKGKLLGSGQLGNIVVRRRLDHVYEQWEDELWMQVLEISHFIDDTLPVVGFCDKNIIVHEHVELKKDLSDPTFNWMQRLCACIDLATGVMFGYMKYFQLVYMISLGDLMFQVLCDKKAEEHATRMAIEHYEKGELEKIIDPNLRLQMHQQSFTIFSKTAYNCIKQRHNNFDDIVKGLEEGLKLQTEHEKYMEHNRIQLNNIMLSTNNFADECLIGSGAYGTVYKAKLDHFDKKGSVVVQEDVAIKRISKREDGQGDQGFFIELSMLGSCEHPNIISLLGYCHEDSERILVYEYAFKQSLNQHLGSTHNKTILTWAQRIRICLDIAYGLNYLHNNTEDKPRLIHRDIKSDNILLGEKWNAKIADFGLSKYHPVNQHASTINASTIAGTSVYLDPEYKRTGKLKKESDIYSFGVVLFEILSGRLAYDPIYLEENGNGIAPVARRHFDEGTLKEMVDPQMKEADEFISNLYYGPNQDSLDTFSKIAYRCLAKSQAERPTIEDIIKELQNALNFQENRKDTLKFSLVDIKLGTENFSDKNCIIRGAVGRAYNGKVQYDNKLKDVIVQRFNRCTQEDDFLTEIEILFKHKHENVIDLVGYCKAENEQIIVYKHASIGSLDMHLSNVILGWAERLKICIDVASALDFLHKGGQGQEVVIHRDIKSASILLNGDWGARISDFGFSLVAPINKKIDDYVINDVFSTPGYCDPSYWGMGFLTKESDIYSLGIVLFEILCGRSTVENYNHEGQFLDDLVKNCFEERRLDEIVFEGIKQQIVPQSLTTFQMIANQCLHHRRQKRPTAGEVIIQLKKALEFQDAYKQTMLGNYGLEPSTRPPRDPQQWGQSVGGHAWEVQELKEKNKKMERYQLELEAQLEAERAQTAELEKREAEREEKIKKMERYQLDLEAQLEAEQARTAELEKREAEREEKIKKMERYQLELEAQLEAERARTAELGKREAEREEKIKKMERYQLELEGQLVAERAQTAELEKREAEREANV